MSKYSSLPDIDTAPDVFETDDTPEVTNEPYFEPQLESNEIERSTLSPGEAAQRFQKATAIDPSEEGANRKRSLYRQYLRLQAGTSEYAYASRDLELEETSAQRLSRLMLEVQELDDQVKEEAEKSEDKEEVRHSMVLSQVTALKYELDSISTRLGPGSMGGKEGEEGDGETTALSHEGLISRKLIARLQQARDPAKISEDGGEHRSAGGATAKAAAVARAAVLEARVADLEKLVGRTDLSDTSASLSTTGSSHLSEGLIATVARTDAQIQLLSQPRVMESALRRVKALIGELEVLEKVKAAQPSRIASDTEVEEGQEGGGAGSDDPEGLVPRMTPEMIEKVNKAYEGLARIDPLIPLAPGLLDRLRSLKHLHDQAAGFGETIQVLTTEQSKLHGELRALASQCSGLEKSFEENERIINRNVDKLDKRTNMVLERLAKLSL